ncbi:MAG: hypothetical protein RL095_1130 [Verrucomicrobiota bacterium]|jgi:hypothetical protein
MIRIEVDLVWKDGQLVSSIFINRSEEEIKRTATCVGRKAHLELVPGASRELKATDFRSFR